MLQRPALLLLLLSLFAACEKDDICVEGDTPLLLITFNDREAPDQLKPVTNLRIVGLGRNTTVNTIADRADLDSIALPLQVTQGSTAFILISNSAEENGMDTGNRDTLVFNYQVDETFISRACGFVANFSSLAPSLTADPDNWMQEVQVLDSTVTQQNQAHVKILH